VWLISVSLLPVYPNVCDCRRGSGMYVSLSRATRINLSFSSTVHEKKGAWSSRLCALTKRRRAAENVSSTFFYHALYLLFFLALPLISPFSFGPLIIPSPTWFFPTIQRCSLSLPLTSSVPSFSVTFDVSRLCRSFGARSAL